MHLSREGSENVPCVFGHFCGALNRNAVVDALGVLLFSMLVIFVSLNNEQKAIVHDTVHAKKIGISIDLLQNLFLLASAKVE